MVGKPNQVIPKAGSQEIPAFEEHFSGIIIDCVGPLPKTKSSKFITRLGVSRGIQSLDYCVCFNTFS